MKRIIIFYLLSLNIVFADTCIKMLDMTDDTNYAKLKISYCEDWTNIQINEISGTSYGENPYINLTDRKVIDKLTLALENSLSLYEKDNISIKKTFNVLSDNTKFIDVYFDSTNEITTVKIDITSSTSSNFFTITNKDKIIKLLEKIKYIQTNGHEELRKIKKAIE